MNPVIKRVLFVGIGLLTFGCTLANAQSSTPIKAEKAATLNAAADRFIDRLHQTLDVGALTDMFAPEFAARYRDYPGDFSPFPTPRMSKPLLTASDDATLRRKLVADWNLAYLTSALLKTHPNADPMKALPAEFSKMAKKSINLQAVAGAARETTLTTAEELNRYLSEADQAIPVLRKALTPEALAAALRPASQSAPVPPDVSWDVMGYNYCYTVVRESMILVFNDTGAEPKLVSLAKAN